MPEQHFLLRSHSDLSSPHHLIEVVKSLARVDRVEGDTGTSTDVSEELQFFPGGLGVPAALGRVDGAPLLGGLEGRGES